MCSPFNCDDPLFYYSPFEMAMATMQYYPLIMHTMHTVMCIQQRLIDKSLLLHDFIKLLIGKLYISINNDMNS